jgi:hypothetical protein
LPDVKTLTIDPAKDQFMVLACDGIWNFMSSQDVCDFILPRLTEGRERLSQIWEEVIIFYTFMAIFGILMSLLSTISYYFSFYILLTFIFFCSDV